MFFAFPLLVTLLAAVLVKWLLEVIFRALGRRGLPLPVLEDRVGAILFLVCADIMGAIAFWYPLYVTTRYAAPDDRFGGVFLFGFPFYFAGAGLSAWALFRLVRALVRGQRSLCNAIYGLCGILLALAGFSPLVMIAHRIIIIRQNG
jgi:hypothetical protein